MFLRALPSITLLAACAAAPALDTAYLYGPRAVAMGGQPVATVDDQTALFLNPSAMGFFGQRRAVAEGESDRTPYDNLGVGRKRWGLGLDVSAGAQLHEDLGTYIDLINEVDLDQLSDKITLTSPQDVTDIVKVAKALTGLDDPQNALTAEGAASFAVRIGRFAIGVRSSVQMSARVLDIDTDNLGLQQFGLGLANEIVGTGSPASSTLTTFSDATAQQLYAALGGTGTFGTDATSTQAVLQLDQAAQQQGVTQEQATQAGELLADVASALGGPLAENRTSALVRGVAFAELPIGYAHPFNDWLSVGGAAKAVFGRVYAAEVRVVNEDDPLGKLFDDLDQYEDSTAVTFDLGATVRGRWFQAAINGRNLTEPTFDGPTIDGVTFPGYRLERQVAIGAAFIPWETLMVEGDLELIETDTLVPDYGRRMASLGVEWNPWRFIALRGGLAKNLAEDDIPYEVSAGVGVNLWLARIDLALAASPETATYDDQDYPTALRASLGVMIDF